MASANTKNDFLVVMVFSSFFLVVMVFSSFVMVFSSFRGFGRRRRVGGGARAAVAGAGDGERRRGGFGQRGDPAVPGCPPSGCNKGRRITPPAPRGTVCTILLLERRRS